LLDLRDGKLLADLRTGRDQESAAFVCAGGYLFVTARQWWAGPPYLKVYNGENLQLLWQRTFALADWREWGVRRVAPARGHVDVFLDCLRPAPPGEPPKSHWLRLRATDGRTVSRVAPPEGQVFSFSPEENGVSSAQREAANDLVAQWLQKAGRSSGTDFWTRIVPADRLVFLECEGVSGRSPSVFALEASTAKFLWARTMPGAELLHIAPAGNTLFVGWGGCETQQGYTPATIVALQPGTGELRWAARLLWEGRSEPVKRIRGNLIHSEKQALQVQDPFPGSTPQRALTPSGETKAGGSFALLLMGGAGALLAGVIVLTLLRRRRAPRP